MSLLPKSFIWPYPHTGKDALRKLVSVREWIRAYTPTTGASPSKNASSPSQRHVGTLVTNLASIGRFAFSFSDGLLM